MIQFNRYLFSALFLFTTATLSAQGVSTPDTVTTNCKPKFERQLRYEAIDKEQQLILNSDGKGDKLFTPSPDADINYFITQSLKKGGYHSMHDRNGQSI